MKKTIDKWANRLIEVGMVSCTNIPRMKKGDIYLISLEVNLVL